MLAASGPEALQALGQALEASEPFRIVLTDATMPKMDGFELAQAIRQNPRLTCTAIMMLTSAGHRGDAARCRELGLEGYLTKPISQSELLAALLTVTGTPRPTANAALVTRHTLRENRKSLRILLAEDNAVNQLLACRLLEMHGHRVDIVDNGRAALERLTGGDFDVVLMDVQMPTMDGFEATAAIRKEEESTGGHLPIIAMTAHAMEGDRERCLAAGMDGYISKPVRAQELMDALAKLDNSAPGVKAPITPERQESEPIDTAAALDRAGGDAELLQQIAELFLKELPGLLTSLRESVAVGDAIGIERAAHKLKGSVGNFSAQPAFDAALKLETVGNEGNLAQAQTAYQELEKELQRLEPVMARLAAPHVRREH